MSNYVALSYLDVFIASLLILINGGISMALGLGLERTLFINTARMTVQLLAIGFVLKFIFEATNPYLTLALAVIMVAFAGREILARQTYRLKGFWAYGLGTMTLLFTGFVATSFAVGVIVQPEPWYKAQYVLPILGMVLGNTMTGIGLGMDSLTTSVKRDQNAIEARLSLGADRFEAMKSQFNHALRTGMMPIINAMAASGIVSLPGMMTGQILSGVDPVEATKYQLMIMFLIAGGTALGTLLGVLGTSRLLTDERHRLRLDYLHTSHMPSNGQKQSTK